MSVFFIVMLGLTGFCLQAQSPDNSEAGESDIFAEVVSTDQGEGIVTINQSARMEALVLTHIDMNKRNKKVEGFRIKLFSGAGKDARKEALEIKGIVLSEFPGEIVNVDYGAPYWRVHAGAFRHKHESLPLLMKLRKEFPSCYIVKVNDIALDSF